MWLSAGDDVDEDAMVAMAILPYARRFSCEENRAQLVARAVLAGLIKKRFSLSGRAEQPPLGLLNC
jgi:hypothetical protein